MIDHLESTVDRAIEQWGVRYFKFDFLVWLDCIGVEPVDMYRYRDAFVAMLDRVSAAHPDVTLQIDETNDYRLFPFESLARGPSWFQNGSPPTNELLHNLWDLAPYVPPSSLGQDALETSDRESVSSDYRMAVALASHLTFRSDLTTLAPDDVATTATWVARYKTLRGRLGGMVFPLLDDPRSGKTWTALQPWDLDAHRGLLLVYRQDVAASTRSVPLRGLRGGPASYRVTDAISGADLGVYSATQLATTGLPVTIATRFGARVLSVEPA
jgi:alpha-galactosidase